MKSVFMVKVSQGASGNEIKGWIGEALKVRVKAPPEKGKANKELRRFLAKTLGSAPGQVAILSGDTSREKKIAVQRVQEKFSMASYESTHKYLTRHKAANLPYKS